ncbi:hypothetical protein DUNSADRAFT_4683 [Dunaliella salina]|uniref:Encoded protein n=1 Tax=Dunaliella salina TaxID=3046 RepID=A0ABQ7FUP7_DUNSA|nr:hypothetical protein DUNSADRAFT_4683 [Dunaliella salina]|eukprot:KAF5826129.1 hypothetical protein DUNSADRAFT_4683 [Dunaliella salina]
MTAAHLWERNSSLSTVVLFSISTKSMAMVSTSAIIIRLPTSSSQVEAWSGHMKGTNSTRNIFYKKA